MNSKQNEIPPGAQAGWSRKALRVAGEVGVLHSSVDRWESITRWESRVRENRMHGLMRGGSRRSLAMGLSIRRLPPTLLGASARPPRNMTNHIDADAL